MGDRLPFQPYLIPPDASFHDAWKSIKPFLSEEITHRLRELPYTYPDSSLPLLDYTFSPEEQRAATVMTHGFRAVLAQYAHNLAEEYRDDFSRIAHAAALRERFILAPSAEQRPALERIVAWYHALSKTHLNADLIPRVGLAYLFRPGETPEQFFPREPLPEEMSEWC